MSNFKLIFIGIFVAAAVVGILVFSGIFTIGGSTTPADVKGSVVIWGTFDNRAMAGFVDDFNTHNQNINISYEAKDPTTFDQTLVEAIANGAAPDLVLLPDNLIWRFQNKLTHISFTSLPAQTFQTTFIGAANVFTAADGTIAVPWAADPLVMYYNRDLLENVGIAQPPKVWADFTASVPLIAKKQSDLTLTQMAAAMGSYKNLAHPKDILALLFLESGSPFITAIGNQISVHFGNNGGATENSGAVAATNFFMGFSDPLKQMYTWNAGEPLDRDAFVQSNLAYYFGTASELPLIRAQNPNLNFGIALPPQPPTGTSITTGHLYAFGIPKAASNQLLSYTATTLLSNAASETTLGTKLGAQLALIPVRRDILSQKPTTDPYLGFLYDAALVQKSWIDPNPIESDRIFSGLVKDISSSTLPVDQALLKAASQLSALGASI